MKLIINKGNRDYNLVFEDKVVDEVSVKELEDRIFKESKLNVYQQRIKTSDGKILKGRSDVNLIDYGIKDGDVLTLKDLGPQISWQTVFLIEYAGPLIIHPLFVLFKSVLYKEEYSLGSVQTSFFLMVFLHFLKREFETLFVHRFSNATMPLSSLFKNTFHYHLLSGFLISYFVYSPNYQNYQISSFKFYLCWILFIFAQLSNLHTHLAFRALRPANSTVRKIPQGYGFELVSCPNYFFEILAWISVSILVNHWSVWLFTIVGAGQMAIWAIKKHKTYRKEFANYPKSRKIMVPFVF